MLGNPNFRDVGGNVKLDGFLESLHLNIGLEMTAVHPEL
jgi:hypothetical protein